MSIILLFILYIIYVIYDYIQNKKIKNTLIYVLSGAIVAILLKIYYDYCTDVEIFVYDSKQPGKTVVVVSGSHAHESGPSEGLDEVKEDLDKGNIQIKNGKLILIPTINKCGRKLNIRWQPQELLTMGILNSDINRNYATTDGKEEGACKVSDTVQKYIKQSDFILDFHEGYSYNKLEPASMGQTFYPGKVDGSKEMAKECKDTVNKEVMSNEPDYKKYDIVEGWPEINGSLRQYANKHNIPYILVEVAGQGNKQTTKEKKDQTKSIFFEFLKQNGLL